MSDSRVAGSLLVLAPIVIIIGALLNPHGFGDWSDTRGLLASLGGDPGLTSVSSLVVMIGFILFAAGFGKIRDLMGDGSGAPFMQIGALFIIVGVAGAAIECGLVAGSGGAAAAPEGRGMATAIALITGAEGVGTLSSCALFIGFALGGISFVIQKNYPMIIGVLLAATGILGLYAASDEYYSDLMGYSCLAFGVMSLVTGVLTIRHQT
mgnify:CR=1 FL=1